jgi:peptide/nickel transport system substrate-binding protein
LKKGLLVLVALALVATALVGCKAPETVTPPAPPEPSGPKVGGQIVFPIGGDPGTLNPIISTDAMSGTVIYQIHSGLVRSNENLEFIGDLAEDWTVSDDNLTLTFKIRDNVLWHDDTPFTAHDVKFTYDTVMHPDYTGVRRRDFAFVEEVQAPDNYTLVLKLKQIDSSLISKLTLGIIPKHIFADVPVAEIKEHPRSRDPIGTGPYKLAEWVSGQYLVLERNPKYFWDGEYPYLEKIIHRIYQDTDAMLAALEAGDIDYMGSIPVDSIELIKSGYSDRYDFKTLKQNGYWYIGMKQDHPIFSNLNVRKALAYGLDRENLIKTLFLGYGTVMNGDKPPISWAHNPNLYNYPYNKAKAIEYLEKAGWTTIGSDGIRSNAAGEKLSFEFISASGDQTRTNMLEIITNQWKEIGVEAKVELYEISVYYDKLDYGEFEIYQWGWNLGLDPDNFIRFHSSSGFDEKGVLQGFNDVGYSNPEVDRLIELARSTFDQETRREAYWKIDEILNDELPYVFLYSRDSVAALNKKFEGVFSQIGTLFIEKWHLK